MTTYKEMIDKLVAEAKELHASERRITIRSMLVVGELAHWRADVHMGIEKFAHVIGLTPDQYLKRSQAARVVRNFPVALVMLEAGETQVSHLAMVAPKINEANHQLILAGIKGKKRKEVEAFISRVTKDGHLKDEEGTVEFKLMLTESQVKELDRAREVLSAGGKVPTLVEVFMQALGDLLKHRDPMRKAERAEVRAQKKASSDVAAARQRAPEEADAIAMYPDPAAARQHPPTSPIRSVLPAALKHAVWLKYEGQCAHRHPDGSRCHERTMLEIDHIVPWCRGGRHELANLTLKCRRHNIAAAEQVLGAAFMSKWTGRPIDISDVPSRD